MISDLITGILLLMGALFMLLAAIGLVRMPDLYMRMHATTKAPAMGMLLLLAGLCTCFPQTSVIIKSLLVIIFIFITAPVSTHLISRTAYQMKVKKWKNTIYDDWEKFVQDD